MRSLYRVLDLRRSRLIHSMPPIHIIIMQQQTMHKRRDRTAQKQRYQNDLLLRRWILGFRRLISILTLACLVSLASTAIILIMSQIESAVM